MWNRKASAAFALIALASWACTPDGYPTEPRFEAPPEEIELPDGELFFYTPPAGVTVTSVAIPGQFSDPEWSTTAIQMVELPDGRWVAGVELEPGTYEYKYFFNGSTWAENMCSDAAFGDPANGGQIDPDLDSCTDGGNAIRTIGTPAHTFRYPVPEGVSVTQVNLVGSMNEWSAPDPAMQMAQVWSITLDLAAGEHQYKYFFNGDTWADNMCTSTLWGDPANGGRISPDAETCNGDGNVVFTLEEAGSVTFTYPVPEGVAPTQVHLVGSVNGWVTADPTMLMDQDFSITLDLEPGEYLYKYHFNGTSWADNMCNSTTWGDPANDGKIDPDVETCVDDGSGGMNGQLIIE